MGAPGDHYRERNPMVAPAKPTRPLTKKVLQEIYAGRRRLQVIKYQDTMPVRDYLRFVDWVNGFR